MKKYFALFFLLLVLFAVPVYAGIMETVKAAASTGNIITGLVLVVLLWIMKTVPNSTIYKIVFGFFEKLGIIVTLGMSRWKWSALFWEEYIEKWFIDLFENTIGALVNGFIAGLRSNNAPPTMETYLPNAPVEPPPYEG